MQLITARLRSTRRPFDSTMAWRYLGQSNAELIAYLKKAAVVRTEDVQSAMLAVDRALFVPQGKIRPSLHDCYNATISAPHMHAHCLYFMMDTLAPNKHFQILDVGSGSGYLTALLSYTVRNYHTSMVIGLEHVSALVHQSIQNCNKIPFLKNMMQTGNLKFIQGDGFQGCLEHAPYDCIHIGAPSEEVPEALLEQLRVGGKLILPLGPETGPQMLTVVDKLKNGEIRMEPKLQVVYVPLTTVDKQLKS